MFWNFDKKNILINIYLVIIILLATIFRLWGITFGLPHVYYTDEAQIVNHAVAFGTGDLNPHNFIYPSLFMYVMFFIYGFIFVFGRIFNIFSSVEDFMSLFFTDVTLFYLPGRLLAAFCGVISIIVLYRFARQAYNERVALIASSFLAFSSLHVTFSHYIKTHVPAGLFVILSLYFGWLFYSRRGDTKYYFLAALMCGFGASTIYHAGLVLFSLFLGHVFLWYESLKHDSHMHLFDKNFYILIVVTLLAFLIGTPFALFDSKSFLSDLMNTASIYHKRPTSLTMFLFPFTSLVSSIGPPLGFIALASLFYVTLRRRAVDVYIASQPLIVGVFLIIVHGYEPSSMIITFAALSLLSAIFLDEISSRLIKNMKWKNIVLFILILFILIIPIKKAFYIGYSFSLPDTRTLAQKWIEQNIPSGTKILMDSGKYYLSSGGPPLTMNQTSLERIIDRSLKTKNLNPADRQGGRRSRYTKEIQYFKYKMMALKENDTPNYDVYQLLHDPGSPHAAFLSLDEYIAEGVQYIILSKSVWQKYKDGIASRPDFSKKAMYYSTFLRSLNENALLMKQFCPNSTSVGPWIRIYKTTQTN